MEHERARELTFRERSDMARARAQKIADGLAGEGFNVEGPYESGNVNDGWIVGARLHGATVNIEIVCGPSDGDEFGEED